MGILRSLIPFIAYAVVGAFASELVAALVGLVLTAALVARARAQGTTPAEMVIDLSSLVFFAAYAVLALVRPGGPQGHWMPAVIQLWLFLTAAGSIAIRHPFTLPIARRHAPEQFAQSPAFYAFTVRITWVWALSFLVSGLVMMVLIATGHGSALVAVVVMTLAIVVPVAVVQRMSARLEAAARA